MWDVTRLLDAAAVGDQEATADVFPLVYAELRRMAGEKPGQTLDATALVHEAHLRLVGGERPDGWDGRGHFFAAEAMCRILLDNARRKKRVKHGGGRHRVEPADLPDDQPAEDLVALDDALTRLAAEDAVAAKVVELRHFASLGHEDIARTLGVTVYLTREMWTFTGITAVYTDLRDGNDRLTATLRPVDDMSGR